MGNCKLLGRVGWVLPFLILICFGASGRTILSPSSNTINISQEADYLQNPSGNLHIRNIQHLDSAGKFDKSPSPGNLNWIAFSLSNDENKAKDFILATGLSEKAELYSFHKAGQQEILTYKRTNYKNALWDRLIHDSRQLYLPIHIPAKSNLVFCLRVENEHTVFTNFQELSLERLTLIPKAQFLNQRTESRQLYAVLFVLGIVLMAFAIINAWIHRSWKGLILVLPALCLPSGFLMMNGGMEYFFSLDSIIAATFRFIVPAVIWASLLGTYTVLFGLRRKMPILHYTLVGSTILCLGSVILMPAISWPIGLGCSLTFALIGSIATILACVRLWREKDVLAGYGFASIFAFSAGSVLYIVNILQPIPQSGFIQVLPEILSLCGLFALQSGWLVRHKTERDKIFQSQVKQAEAHAQSLSLNLEEARQEKLIQAQTIQELTQKLETTLAEMESKVNVLLATIENKDAEVLEKEKAHNILLAKYTDLHDNFSERLDDAQEPLVMNLQELLGNSRELHAIIYRTSHDIRGPLASLLGLVSLARMESHEEHTQDYLSKIHGRAEKLDNILRKLNTIYHIKSMHLHSENMEVEPIVREAMARVQGYEGAGGIHFSVAVDKSMQYCTDPRLFRFILFNLLENSVKYQKQTEKTIGWIEVSIKKTADQLSLFVRDNGIGIKTEDEPYLFEIFTPAAAPFQTPGLGLYMTRNCVERLRGSIKMNRNAGITEFEVRLPVLTEN